MNRYNEAISDYTLALEIDKDNLHAMFNRAICYERSRQFVKAIEEFTRLIQMNPGLANAYYNRGICYDRYKIV